MLPEILKSLSAAMLGATFWLSMKTFELWFFSIENWSNIVSWWWFAVLPLAFIAFTMITIYTERGSKK